MKKITNKKISNSEKNKKLKHEFNFLKWREFIKRNIYTLKNHSTKIKNRESI